MKNKIIYKNFIPKKYLNKKYSKKINKKFKKTLKNINENLNYAKDATHSFSKNFNFNFGFKQINKFKKFKTVVVIGMGGSSLGSEAIYHF